MKIFFHTLLFLFFSFTFLSAQTTIQKNGNEWQLMVDGEHFDIKGVTFGYDNDTNKFESYFQDLQFLGVNTIRTWGTSDNTSKLLDVAHAHGIKVMVGIWMRHGRAGMEDDDSFNYLNDKKGMEAMYDEAIATVEKYKNHPAVLTWGVGNEVYLNMATDAEKEAYSKLLERICSTIKDIDPDHPITSVEAWTLGLDWWEKLVPSIDIYGLNSYGAGAGFLEEELKKRDIDKPYIITEFGVTGEWDISEQKNGIKVEPNDQQKYDAIATGFHEWIENKASCLGVFVFHYSNGDEFAAPWLFTHYKKYYRPQYWAIREAYTGKKPENYVPVIDIFKVPDSKKESGAWIPVTLSVSDIENDSLEISFSYNQRTGSRKRRDQINPLSYRGNQANGFEIKLPKEDGAIKIYVNVADAYGNMGIASTSILVADEEASNRKYLVPKTTLPFYVYKDGVDMPYIPSAFMGNYESLEVDINHTSDFHSGEASLKISYKAADNWYGIGFVDPPNDWGTILGGYDLNGAQKLTFWAKASHKNIKATFGFGMIDNDKPFPDTGKASKEIVLTTKWKKYTIKTKKLDLSCIRTGFVMFSSGIGMSHHIYIDDIVFE